MQRPGNRVLIPGTLFFCPESENNKLILRSRALTGSEGNTLTGVGDKEGDEVVQKEEGQEEISRTFAEFEGESGP